MSQVEYLLDTNVWNRVFSTRQTSVRDRFSAVPRGSIAYCSVVRWELEFGFLKRRYTLEVIQRQKSLLSRFPSLVFDDRCAVVAATIRYHLETLGMRIESPDIQIAAIAMANDVTLITHNASDFARIPGLRWEDWER